MHSFVLNNKHADTWFGTHQKLNRLAYRSLRSYILAYDKTVQGRAKLARFPSLKLIQHFEGINGPDGLRLKSPGQNEMPHFYNPNSDKPQKIIKLLGLHLDQLSRSITTRNEERAAFEASWLAHTIVDGLTPAHHFPYEEHMEAIRGEGGHTRNTTTKKLLVKGNSTRDSLRKSWQVIGAKGLLSTHINFEGGVATVLLPLRMRSSIPSAVEVAYAREHGLEKTFEVTAKAIAKTNLYERFYRHGWTITLARDVRRQLLPPLVKTVVLAWLLALDT